MKFVTIDTFFNQKRYRRGFTIVELLIVVVVIAILSTVTVAAYSGIATRAKNAQIAAAFDAYDKALQMYYIQTGTYPSSTNGSMNVVCLGQGYEATVDLGANECQRINGTPTALVATAFDASLVTIMKNKPSINPETSYSGPHPLGTVAVRGIIYNGGQETPTTYIATMTYYLKGSQSCGRGDAVVMDVSGTQMTQCALRYRNNSKVPVTAPI